MKKIVNFILIFFAVFAVSCSDFLEENPKTLLSPDKAFSTPQAFKLLGTGLYGIYWDGYTRNPDNIFLMCLPADDICSDRDEWQWGQQDLFTNDAASDRYNRAATWSDPFACIASANEIINNYSLVPVNNDTEKALVDNIRGQAYFQRGHWLLFMSRFWGPIPMPLVNDGAILPKSNLNDVFDQGINDLEMAEELLPSVQTEADWRTEDGRFSVTPLKYAAQAMQAQAYLQSTGWPLFRTENYAKAAAKAKEVMNFAEANPDVLGLLPVEELWAGLNFWDKECVWGFGYQRNSNRANIRVHMGETPDEELPTGTGWATNLAEIYFYENFPEGERKKVTFRTNIWITPEGPTSEAMRDEFIAYRATLSAPPAGETFGADWPVRRWNGLSNTADNSRSHQCDYTWQNFDPDTDIAAGKFFFCQRWGQWNVQVPWDDYINNPQSRRHPYYAKGYFDASLDQTYVPVERTVNADGTVPAWGWETRSLGSGPGEGSGRLSRWMRYAEVLLIYAEAQAMAHGLDQSCIDALNQVRSRAKETRGLAQLNDYTSPQDFQRKMFDERGWEFAGLEYGQRWADLLRFERAKEMNSSRINMGNWPDGRPKERTINPEFYANEKRFYYLMYPATEKARTGFLDNDASVDPINPPE